MAKLTLSFKDRILKVIPLPAGESLIGRDPACDIVIDSLAVSPQHARIRLVDGQYTLEPVDDGCAVSIDDEPLSDPPRALSDGERILIGKHRLTFSSAVVPTENRQAQVVQLPATAWLQIQSGAHLGRTIRLNKAFTRVGKPNGDLAVIAHRDDGYYLSTLQGDEGAQVNDEAVGEQSRKLSTGDRIMIGELSLQFFADGVSVQASDLPPTEQADERQRQFSRIPFDVRVSLHAEDQHWDTDLLDISLHGALVRLPATFEPADEQAYRLTVHLEGDLDIAMDVETAHRDGSQLGLRCTHIDLDSITHLRRLVELNLGDADLLERELSALG